MIGSRKRLPPELVPAFESFLAVLEVLEPAKAALTDVLPGTRMPGRPLADALAAFESGLERADERMSGWRCPQTDRVWSECREGLRLSRSLALRVRDESLEPEGFEGLLGLVESLLDPLELFTDAEVRFRELRTRHR